MQEFQCEGIWWLPTAPSDQLVGKLIVSSEFEITLSLAGVFGDQSNIFEKNLIPIVLGIAWDCPLDKLFTLKDCIKIGHEISSPGITREKYFCGRLFAGAHIESEDDFSFSRATVQFSGLPSWAEGLTGLAERHVFPGEGQQNELEIQWVSTESLGGKIPGGQVLLRVGAKISGSQRKRCIEEFVQFDINCEQPISAEELHKRYIYSLQNFMTLATDHPNALVDFYVNTPNNRNPIKVLAAQTYYDKSATDLFSYKMLFTLADIRERAVELIARWIELSDRLRDVLSLYFSTQYKPDSYVDIKFFVVFQSLEVYERRRSINEPNLTSEDGRSLKGLMQILFEEHWALIGPLFGSSLETAVDEVMTFRNFVVHRDSRLGEDQDYGQRLFWLTQRLMFLMKACLLSELGIQADDRARFFNRNQMYIHLLSLAGK